MTDPTWRATFERYGMPPEVQGGILPDDPFSRMALMAESLKETAPPASVAVMLSTASEDYSRARVTVTITCPCPSTEPCIAFTTEATFIIAKRMVNQAAETLGLPQIG
jgi:hypothetical protein